VKRLVPFLAVLALVVGPALCAGTGVARAADTKPAKPAKTDAKAPAVTPAVTDSLGLLERAVAKDSTKFDNLYKLGIMYLDREQNAEAARVFTKANQVKPKNVKVLVNLGVALDNLSRSDDAQGYYKQAIALAPNDSLANCRLASSLYAQGKFADSVGLLRNLIAKQPRWPCAYFTMGVAFADAGLYRDAIRMWKKVVELEPTSAEAQSAKESIDVLEKFLSGQ
jgi:tetratricopeptide (TPR) repeat protein